MPTIVEAVEAKLNRVPEKLKAIKAHSDTYIAKNPPQIIMDGNGKTTLDMPAAAVPPEISVQIGEIIYQLRSTLDHLAFHLVKLNPNGSILPVDWEEDCQFPLWTELKVGQVPPLPFGCFRKILPGISAKAHTFIEGLQPYYGVGKVNNCLRILKELSNRDKHRHLVLTRSRSQVHETRRWANGATSTGYMSHDHGAEINLFDRGFGSDSNVQMSFKLAGFITFNEPILGDANAVWVEELLQWLFESVQDVVVPEFKLLFENP